MTRDADIHDKIFRLTRGDLDSAVTALPNLRQLFATFELWEIVRVSAFWRDTSMQLGFDAACHDFVTGLANLGAPIMFSVRGEPTHISVGVGAARRAGSATDALRGLLAASFPDLRARKFANNDADASTALHGAILTGIPAAKSDSSKGLVSEQIEKVCRSLYGSRWRFVVCAEPKPRAEVVAAVNSVTMEIRAVQGSVMLKGTVDEENRVAKLYTEVLEAQAKRLQLARSDRFWNVQAMLVAETEGALARGTAALMNAYAGEQSYPVPFRVIPCQARSGVAQPPGEPLTSHELSVLVRIPRESYPGYEVVDPARFSLRSPIDDGAYVPAIRVGDIIDRGQTTGNPFCVRTSDLAKHTLISGVTGSGKTNSAFGLLEALWEGQRVPFLVIESAKSEYRDLLALPAFATMKVFTLGDETVAPFRLNPFEVPAGVLVQTHVDYVKALFAASFVLYPPMPYVLEQSLQEVYEDCGWDLAANQNRRSTDPYYAFPTLTQLHRKVAAVVWRMGYDSRIAMDVTAGLQARINQLRIGGGKGRMLDTRTSVPMSELFEGPCLLELQRIVSDDEKAFLIGLIVIRLLEHLEGRRGLQPERDLVHVTFIEEAHRLLRNVSEKGGEDTANPRGKGVEVFANILAEVRALREGIVILEQIPTKLAPEAIKNTNLKIVHRIVARDDRDVLGAAMQATAPQAAHFGVLPAGEAVVFAEGMNAPALVSVPLSRAKQGATAVADARVREAWRSAADPAVYQRSRWCARCPSGASGSPCRSDTSVALGSERPAFEAFHSALVHNRAFLRDTYVNVGFAIRGSRPAKESFELTCSLNAFLEESIERRGRYAGWPGSAIAELGEAASAVTSAMAQAPGTESPRDADRAVAKIAARYARLHGNLSKVDDTPFVGCRLCDRRCVFRYEASPQAGGVLARDKFREEFFDSGGGAGRLALVSWDMSKAFVHLRDVTTRRGMALCFAAQASAALGLSVTNQAELVGEVLAGIQSLAEDEHGKRPA